MKTQNRYPVCVTRPLLRIISPLCLALVCLSQGAAQIIKHNTVSGGRTAAGDGYSTYTQLYPTALLARTRPWWLTHQSK